MLSDQKADSLMQVGMCAKVSRLVCGCVLSAVIFT